MSSEEREPKVELEVKDFGPIAEAKVELRPLTVFVGPSNTGKSYLAILMYALQVALAAKLDPSHRVTRIIELESERPRAEQPDDLRIQPAVVELAIEWLQQLETDSSDVGQAFATPVPDLLSSTVRQVIATEEETGQSFARELGRCFGVGETLDRLVRSDGLGQARAILRFRYATDTSDEDYLQYALTFGNGDVALDSSLSEQFRVLEATPSSISLVMATQFLRMRLSRADDEEHEVIARTFVDELAAAAVGHSIGALGKPAYYLPADRSGVMDAHNVVISALVDQAVEGGIRRQRDLPLLSGVLADFLRELISMGKSPEREGSPNKELAVRLEADLLGGAVRHEVGETRAPLIEFVQGGDMGPIPLMRASSMVSELAPVVLYLRHLVDPGETLIIEEPESHLHPAAQAKFASLLARLVNSGVRVVVTTHSNWFVDQLANLVRMSELDPDDRTDIPGHEAALDREIVGVWRFAEDSDGEGSTVTEIDFDPDGVGYEPGYFGIANAQYDVWTKINNRIANGKLK